MRNLFLLLIILFSSSVSFCQVMFGIDLDDREQFLKWNTKVYFDDTYYTKLNMQEFDGAMYSAEKKVLQLNKMTTTDDFFYGCWAYLSKRLGPYYKKDDKYDEAARSFNWTIANEVLLGYRSYSIFWESSDKYFMLNWEKTIVSVTIKYKE